jgi:hypothetical protein
VQMALLDAYTILDRCEHCRRARDQVIPSTPGGRGCPIFCLNFLAEEAKRRTCANLATERFFPMAPLARRATPDSARKADARGCHGKLEGGTESYEVSVRCEYQQLPLAIALVFWAVDILIGKHIELRF